MFIGNQKERLLLADLAKKYKIDFSALLAVIEVESNGVIHEIINGKPMPIVRYEGHYFDRLCNPKIREKARKAEVSSPKTGGIKNPSKQKDRWLLIEKAATFDKNAAYESSSYGVGQVMGVNWKNLGYSSVFALVNKAQEGLVGQVELMLEFIVFNKLDDELRNLDWSGFARGYNGSQYAKNKYHIKLAAAYKNQLGDGNISPKVVNNLRIGSKGIYVRELQSLLVLAGYVLKVDGDFGNSTKEAVKDFQKKNNLTPDGIVGVKTQQAIASLREMAPEDAGHQKISNISNVKVGTVSALGIPTVLISAKDELNSLIEQISPISQLSKITEYVNISIGVISVALVLFGAYKIYSGCKEKYYSYIGSV